MNTRTVEAELFHPDRRTEGRTEGRTDKHEANSCVSQFNDTGNKGNFVGPTSKYNTIDERKYDK